MRKHSLLWHVVLITAAGTCCIGSPACSSDQECGWNSHCQNGQCWCKPGYSYSEDGQHCVDTNCAVKNCLECIGETSCRRCSNFLVEESGECVDSCSKDYSLVIEGDLLGKVCNDSRSGLSMLYVAIIIAVCSGILLTILLSLAIYWKTRTDRERELRLRIMGQMLNQDKEQRIDKESKELCGHFNYSYAPSDEEKRLRKLHYAQQLATLKPHVDTLLAMLKEAKVMCRGLSADDKRVFVFRNLIHELCRVISLLTDSGAPMPPDGNLLLDWAGRILKEYIRTHQPPGEGDSRNTGSTATSTFKPDQKAALSSSADSLADTAPVNSYSYQRLTAGKTEPNMEVAEISSTELLDRFTEPVEV